MINARKLPGVLSLASATVAAPAATSVQGCRNAASPAAAHSDIRSTLAIQVGGLCGRPLRRCVCTASRISTTPAASLTARAASDGAVCGLGGLLPVARMTAAITATRQASQPRMYARPFQIPFWAASTRTNAVSGNGTNAIPSPMRSRLSTTPPQPQAPGAARPSQALLSRYLPRFHRVDHGLVVTLILIRVGGGEPRDGPVENIRATQVGGDGDAVAGPRVRPGQGPAAHPAIHLQPLRAQSGDLDGELPVPQLPDVEVPGLPVQARLD